MKRQPTHTPNALYACESQGGDFTCAQEYTFPAEDLLWCPSIERWVCFNCIDEEESNYGYEGGRVWIKPTLTLQDHLLNITISEEEQTDLHMLMNIILDKLTELQEFSMIQSYTTRDIRHTLDHTIAKFHSVNIADPRVRKVNLIIELKIVDNGIAIYCIFYKIDSMDINHTLYKFNGLYLDSWGMTLLDIAKDVSNTLYDAQRHVAECYVS